ncbi:MULTISPECIES: hypothetical protein [Cyanophyceae]|uniref:UPF0367 protein SYNPCC7002_A0153 n=1 Tax=Picosynechococcus sp. (strain ATCC 27264 / PCC 7002 / PR-6) TaxID=32049 RepID=Y153_PICP2|nr:MULTISPECIES: hypothetical protein [Cyanophyceae]B1XM20.1 RecName: Full=UPF0367 protein SYNPCC7002_A0153 [Picosynechococcus sp. PCC 7002]ACA98167.1 conserved hypothetical protein [Picosynechococcus sp. PCC 7002]ANV86134.1 hypothetical protein AWQ22_00830 [Picosynechococcus sp. PCC 7117]ANV89311.1 hypothetical protein AWQ24_00875 [Picosynechococcus sp. PCC 8807]SMH43966.1 hypothetical protein SAMN06272755_1436 [Picosynechococcus sp. OG1]SMQ79658.1 hypothetical protein SAMN06272774_0715 [Syn
MYSLDLTLKYSPIPVSVQRKEADAAQALYQSVLEAMKGDYATLLELTCEKDEDKKIALLSDQISAVVLNKKSGAAAGGRVPGFFATQAAE